MLVMGMSHTCCSLASMKVFPYFCSHSRRPRRVQMLKNPTSSLDEMLFRNHSWNRDALEGQEPPQQHGWDRQKGLTMTDPHRLVPPTHSRPSSPCCLSAQSKALQLWCYLGHWCRWTKFNNLRASNVCGIGFARHSDAQVAKIRDMPTPAWLWTLKLQPGTNLHIANLSRLMENTSYPEQSFLISDPKL